MANTNPLRVVIEGVDRITAPLRRINRRIERMTDPIRRVNGALRTMAQESSIGRLGESIGNVGRSLGNTVQQAGALAAKLGAVGAVAGGVFGVLVNGYTTSATESGNWAARLGIGVEKLQQWQYAAGKFDIENDALIDGMKELTLRADEFVVTGAGPAAEAFQRIGLSGEALRKTGGDTEKLFDLVLGKLREIKNVSARQRLADELFGGSGGEQFTEMLSASSEEMQKLLAEAKRLGIQLDEESIGNARQFSAGMHELTSALEGARNTLLGPLMPALTKLAKTLSDLLVKNRDRIKAFGEALAERLPDTLRSIRETFASLADKFEGFLELIRPITDRFGLLNTVLVAVGAVLAGPLLMAIAGFTQALVMLGVAIATTPVGWFLAAIAAIAGAAYLIYKNWDGISQWFSDKFAAVREAFDTGLLQGITALLREFNPVLLVMETIDAIVEYLTGVSLSAAAMQLIDTMTAGIRAKIDSVLGAFDGGIIQGITALLREFNPVLLVMEAIDAIVEYVTGVSLSDVGSDLVGSLWDGIQSRFEGLTKWFEDKIKGLTDLVPDWMKSAGGKLSELNQSLGKTVAGFFGGGDEQGGANPAALAAANPRIAETVRGVSGGTTKSEAKVGVRFENPPAGMRIEQQSNTGVALDLELGHSMGGS